MPFTLPLKTTEGDLDILTGYLKNQVGWVALSKVKSAIPSKHADNRKVEAARYLGLIDRDGENVKLTAAGREYASEEAKRAPVIRQLIHDNPLYRATIDWMHYQGRTSVNKTEVANQWHEHHQAETAGASTDTLSQSAVFFLRLVGVAELGRFVVAGKGRDTHVDLDAARLEAFVTGASGEGGEDGAKPPVPEPPLEEPPPPQKPPAAAGLSVGTGLNVNLEIHIAADAKPATVEEIFKNMRKYLIDGPVSSADGN